MNESCDETFEGSGNSAFASKLTQLAVLTLKYCQ